MSRINEIKSIMRKLRDSKNESVESSGCRAVNEALRSVNEDTDTENDASEADLVLARLEDILSRFEKVIAAAEGGDEEDMSDEDMGEEEAPAEEEGGEEEEAAEESYTRSLEDRLAALERRFTESRRRAMCRSFRR